MADQPYIIVLGGPNGAGKSTAAAHLLPADLTFVNADEVAKTLPSYPSREADVEAGRLVLEQLDELERQRASFAVETTLAGRSLAVRAERLRQAGYLFRLVFIWAPSADYSIERVAHRVRAGGHDIPEATIRRRYDAGLKNFFQIYQPLADLWDVHENTGIAGFRIIAEGRRDGTIAVSDPELWERMKRRG